MTNIANRDPLPPIDVPEHKDLPDIRTPGQEDFPEHQDLPDPSLPPFDDVPESGDLPDIDHPPPEELPDLPEPPDPPDSDPLPRGPNEDMSNLARPPTDVDEPRLSDDDDLEAEGGGFTDTPLRTPYESMARRDEVARLLEELLIEAQEWADQDGSAEALDIYESLSDVFERLGAPTEDTDGLGG